MREEQGNLFNFKGDAICITTNGITKLNHKNNKLEAVMGAGVARQAAERFPHLPSTFAKLLFDNGHHTQFLIQRDNPNTPYHVISLPTKYHWKQKSFLSLIERSVRELVELADTWVLHEVALTRPGCGLGGLNWIKDVKPVIEKILDDRFVVINPR